ncbi:MAG: nuclear transport factor 2 family protein [Burkholderiaceae bacterium]|nr:nuclear transport factor 2 family protein [Burkholderiaceae bacterium]HLS55823.1 SgcJ/EcaC family oxidoreductase [Zeimonas sp.]
MRRAPIFSTADAVEEAFYDAMQRADLEAMMSLWADDEEVMCVHPGHQRLIGLDAIRASWAAIFANGGVDVRPSEVRTHTGAMLAVHNLVEQVVVTGRTGHETVACVATNVYVKYASGWRILLHHSGPGGEESPTLSSATVLH